MDLPHLTEEVGDKKSAVRFLQGHGVLHASRRCAEGHDMILTLSDTRDRWRCHVRSCRREIPLKSGTWLERTHLPYRTVVLFVYCWSKELTSIAFCQSELGMKSKKTIVGWNHYLREICARSLLSSHVAIGGPNCTVEIDESLLVRRKCNAGRLCKDQWIVGGVCRETGHCFMYAVDNRSASTLANVIASSVLPGSTIVTDCWRGHMNVENIPDMNYRHLTVHCQEDFGNPASLTQTHTVEGMWNLAKMKCKERWGVVDNYLCEFIYRRRNHNKDIFKCILHDISLQYSCN